MMRSHMSPDSNLDTELAAWEHLEKKAATLPPPWWPPVWKVRKRPVRCTRLWPAQVGRPALAESGAVSA